MKLLIKEPKNPDIPWPPNSPSVPVPVSRHRNFPSLVKHYNKQFKTQRSRTVWDVIIFNFQTEDIGEVNFYLEKKVGCTRTTSDGKHYTFHGAKPGLVYWPPVTWNPSTRFTKGSSRSRAASNSAVKSVADVIDQYGRDCPLVKHEGMRVSGADLQLVALKIRNRSLGLIIDQKGRYLSPSDDAAYDSVGELGNTVILRGVPKTRTEKLLAIHEAAHAACDVSGYGIKERKHTEQIAYAVQSVVAAKHFKSDVKAMLTNAYHRGNPPSSGEIYFFGWAAVFLLEKKHVIATAELDIELTNEFVNKVALKKKTNAFLALKKYVDANYKAEMKKYPQVNMDGINEFP